MASNPTHLQPSELGTKEYWDKLYSNELSNHEHDPTDTGTNWFEDSGAQDKVVEFLDDFFSASPSLPWEEDEDEAGEKQQQQQQQQQQQEEQAGKEEEDDDDDDDEARLARARARVAFLDLGTGNGDMLFGLRDASWTGPMLGVDYSERSVEFARRIGAARRAGLVRPRRDEEDEDEDEDEDDQEEEQKDTTATSSPPERPVDFQIHDLLAGEPAPVLAASRRGRGWDVVLDKGTFDAISLSAGVDARTGRRVAESYRDRVLPLVRPGGLFLVTSCNWTEDELARWFIPPPAAAADGDQDENNAAAAAARFHQVGRVEYPSFSFGGVKGSTISTLCFRKITGGSA